MIHFLLYYFALPYGAVWSNVIAIVPTAIIGFVWLNAKNEVRHLETRQHMNNLHDKIDKNHEEHMQHIMKIHLNLGQRGKK